MRVIVNNLPCDACGAAVRHVPNCVFNGGSYDLRKKSPEEILNSRREQAAKEAQEHAAVILKARLSIYKMVRLSPQRWAVIVSTGCVAMNEDPYCECFRFVEGCERLEYWPARVRLARLRREEENGKSELTQVSSPSNQERERTK